MRPETEIIIFHHPDNHCPTKNNVEKNQLALLVTRPSEPLSGQEIVKLAEHQNPSSYLSCRGCGNSYQPQEILENPSESSIYEIKKFTTDHGAMPARKLKNS